jgi:hypothetical protein
MTLRWKWNVVAFADFAKANIRNAKRRCELGEWLFPNHPVQFRTFDFSPLTHAHSNQVIPGMGPSVGDLQHDFEGADDRA